MEKEFVGRHLIFDAITYTPRNLSSTTSVYNMFEILAKELDMTMVLPPVVLGFPFANSEISNFLEDAETELKRRRVKTENLKTFTQMKQFLHQRQEQECGVTGFSIWAESHASIHSWSAENYFAFDAFSCKDYQIADAIAVLYQTFDIRTANCMDVARYMGLPHVARTFFIDEEENFVIDGKSAGPYWEYKTPKPQFPSAEAQHDRDKTRSE